jgi:hypothetical protein
MLVKFIALSVSAMAVVVPLARLLTPQIRRGLQVRQPKSATPNSHFDAFMQEYSDKQKARQGSHPVA